MKQCLSCQAKTLKRGTTTLRRTVDGVVFEGEVPATVCKKYGESLIDAEPLERFEVG